MNYQIQKISESFRLDLRLLEFYLADIRKSIEKLKKESSELKNYVEGGGSIEVKSKTIVKEDGTTSRTMGIADNPWAREALSFALDNRIEQLKTYVDLSLIMSFTYLMTTFDAKYIDVIKTYFKSISDTFPSGVTVENKTMKFAYKSFARQMTSLKVNYNIDIENSIGKSAVKTLIEIRETRNIHIHNSGIVNRKYLDNVSTQLFSEGQYRIIDESYLEAAKDLIKEFFFNLTEQIYIKIL